MATLSPGAGADAQTQPWHPVLDTDGTMSLYSSRCELHDTRTVPHGASLEIRFPG
jgi:hypothetical protein